MSGLPPVAIVGADIPVRQLRANIGFMHRSKRYRYSITASARTSSADGTWSRGLCGLEVNHQLEFDGKQDVR